ncbi:MAG: ORF6N domain-containing protein [Thermodesulfovibrionia bacterium]|nr:ORF6N domain-containing protein [Thermodesulfovibrionia bacterium]
MTDLIPVELIEGKIYLIRKQKVMLDQDLAKLYGVETKVLVQAVKRNIDRFPDDFMFQLNSQEFVNLRLQFVTSSWGGRRYHPFAFTEQGVAMLSSVLKSKRAIHVNIAIMRAFVKLRDMLSTHKELANKLIILENRITNQDKAIYTIFEAINHLKSEPKIKHKKIAGFGKD